MSNYDKDNIFARILRGEIPNHTIYEDKNILAMMDIMPMSKGHCLVLPKSPSRNLLDASPKVLSTILPIVQKIAKATKSAMNANGIIIQQFNEELAGQSVFHLHFHIIPVYEGKKLKKHVDEMADAELLAKQAKAIASEI